MACFGDTNKGPQIQEFFPLHSRVVDDSSSPWIMFEDSHFASWQGMCHMPRTASFDWWTTHFALRSHFPSQVLRSFAAILYLGYISCFSWLVESCSGCFDSLPKDQWFEWVKRCGRLPSCPLCRAKTNKPKNAIVYLRGPAPNLL